jgi:tRNA (guanine-N(7)-)-methyltransferase subunit TRM82
MLLPYQCVQKCGGVFVAATVSRIDTFDIENGSWLSSWNCPAAPIDKYKTEDKTEDDGRIVEAPAQSDFPDSNILESGPPPKKRRLSAGDNAKETTTSKANGHNPKAIAAAKQRQRAPAIVTLKCTKDGNHVIAVTGEDKSIRVLEHDGKGQLRQLSQR